MAKDYYSKKVEMTKFIGLLAMNGTLNLKQIEAKVYEKYGFGPKHVKQTIDSQIELGRWFWHGDILKDLNQFEEEQDRKWKGIQNKDMQELDDILKEKGEK